MTATEKIKTLREQAWALQNKVSGRPGLSSGTSSLPNDVKNNVHKFCSAAITACTDFEQGYIDPEDFNERADRFYIKLTDIKTLIDEAANIAPVKPDDKSSEALESAFCSPSYSQDTRSVGFEQAANVIMTSSGSVNLQSHGISDVDIAHIVDLCDSSQPVRKLDLSNNAITDYGCQLLAGFLISGKCPALFEIIISGNLFGMAGTAALKHGLQCIRKDLTIQF
jgi:hypothetical protein